jgi:cell division protein FtsB
MHFSGGFFILAIVAMSMLAWVITTAIRAKHGYPITDDWGNKVSRGDLDDRRRLELLGRENDRLHNQVGRLEERLAVLERIATDPAERTARAIEQLR